MAMADGDGLFWSARLTGGQVEFYRSAVSTPGAAEWRESGIPIKYLKLTAAGVEYMIAGERADVDAAIAHAESRGLHGHDVHGRNVVQHRGRGHIVDISDFLDPTPCRAWRDLRWAYHVLYRPLIAPTGLRAPGPLLALVRPGYRVFRRLQPA
jgi:hypothetical protein